MVIEMKIVLSLIVEVDPAAWAEAYDVPRKDVRADVRRYVEAVLPGVEMPRCATLALKPVAPSTPVPAPAAAPTPAAGPERPPQNVPPAGGHQGAPAMPGGREAGETTAGGPQASQRGGEVRDVQPQPGAAPVLAGAESRRDSGPSTLPTSEIGTGRRTPAGRPGPLAVRAAVPPAGVLERSLVDVARRRVLGPVLAGIVAVVLALTVAVVASGPGANHDPATVRPLSAPTVTVPRPRRRGPSQWDAEWRHADPDRWDLSGYAPRRRRPWKLIAAVVIFGAILCAGATSGEWLA